MFRKIASIINNVRIKQKIFIAFIIVAFVPIIIVGVYLTNQFRNHVLEQATEQSYNNVERIKSQLEDVISRPIDISGILVSDSRLSYLINTDFRSTAEVVRAYQEYQDFKQFTSLYSEIYNIKFYSENTTLLNNWEFIHLTDQIKNSEWYPHTEASGLIYWSFAPDETKKNQSFLTLVRKVEFPLYQSSGVLVMNISPENLRNIVKQETFDTYIFDSNGVIITAKDSEATGKNITEMDFSIDRTNWDVGQYELEVNGEPSRIIVQELKPPYSQNGIKVMSVFTVEQIVNGADRISRQGLMIMVISIIVSLILVYITTALISKRILVLNKDINKLSTGDLTVNSSVTGNDEIGLLSRQFNNMVINMRDLMNRIRITESQKSQLELNQRDIKLKMMASQINPHFLFNALESIRMHAHINGDKELANIVRMLGKMIRKNLEVGYGFISLSNEVEVIRCYLEIQKFRYGSERLIFTMDIDEDALDFQVPPLLLQPIVENAVIHGMDQMIEEGRVHIKVKLVDESLNVLVMDNGQGMSQEKLQQLLIDINQVEEEEGSRIGLRNVNQRLVMIYGEQAKLQIQSTLGEGTTVSFVIHKGGEANV